MESSFVDDGCKIFGPGSPTMINNKCDLYIVCDGSVWRGHRPLFASLSEHFNTLIKDGMNYNESTVFILKSHVDSVTAHRMVCWWYNLPIEYDDHEVRSRLKPADEEMLHALRQIKRPFGLAERMPTTYQASEGLFVDVDNFTARNEDVDAITKSLSNLNLNPKSFNSEEVRILWGLLRLYKAAVTFGITSLQNFVTVKLAEYAGAAVNKKGFLNFVRTTIDFASGKVHKYRPCIVIADTCAKNADTLMKQGKFNEVVQEHPSFNFLLLERVIMHKNGGSNGKQEPKFSGMALINPSPLSLSPELTPVDQATPAVKTEDVSITSEPLCKTPDLVPTGATNPGDVTSANTPISDASSVNVIVNRMQIRNEDLTMMHEKVLKTLESKTKKFSSVLVDLAAAAGIKTDLESTIKKLEFEVATLKHAAKASNAPQSSLSEPVTFDKQARARVAGLKESYLGVATTAAVVDSSSQKAKPAVVPPHLKPQVLQANEITRLKSEVAAKDAEITNLKAAAEAAAAAAPRPSFYQTQVSWPSAPPQHTLGPRPQPEHASRRFTQHGRGQHGRGSQSSGQLHRLVEALKQAGLDFRSCSNGACGTEFPYVFRGITENPDHPYLILKCSDCGEEVHRWEL